MIQDTTVAARYARALFMVTAKARETAHALGDLPGPVGLFHPGTRPGACSHSPWCGSADKRARCARCSMGARPSRSRCSWTCCCARSGWCNCRPSPPSRSAGRAPAGHPARAGVTRVPLLDAERQRLHAEIEKMPAKKIRLTAAWTRACWRRAGAHRDRVIDLTGAPLPEPPTETSGNGV